MQLQPEVYNCPSCDRSYSRSEFGRDSLGAYRCRHCIAHGKALSAAPLQSPVGLKSHATRAPIKTSQLASPPITPQTKSSAFASGSPNVHSSTEANFVAPIAERTAMPAVMQPQMASSWFTPGQVQAEYPTTLLNYGQYTDQRLKYEWKPPVQVQMTSSYYMQRAQDASTLTTSVTPAQVLQMPVSQIKGCYLTPLESHLLSTFVSLVQSRT